MPTTVTQAKRAGAARLGARIELAGTTTADRMARAREIAKADPRAKKVRPDDLIDRRYLQEFEKSGFFDKLWEGKR